MANFQYTLKLHNVTLIDERQVLLRCNQCGQPWSPILLEGGRLPKGYWKCPKGCNHTPKEFKHSSEVRAYFAKRNRDYKKRKETT